MESNQDISKEKSQTEQTITILIMRLNKSIAELDSIIKFPTTNKPHNRNLYKIVYQDIFELSYLTRASLSNVLINQLKAWRINFNEKTFINNAIQFTELIYDELSDSGMIDIRARKTSTFPIEYYTNQLEKI